MQLKKSQSGYASASKTWVILLVATLATALATGAIAQQILPVRVNRCLELQQIVGTVTYRHGQTSQAAQIHTCLEDVGDAVITGQSSSAKLGIDTGIGTIRVSENTTLEVQQLDTAADGGKITRLKVIGGQVQLRVRPFTQQDSILEIQTPAGVSGVRGTEFGVSVQPNGTTGMATLEGSVSASAQGQMVKVDAGLQSMIIPGEPPSPPSLLKNDPSLDLRYLAIADPVAVGQKTVKISGQIDPVNLLVIADQTQNVSRGGEFDLQIPLPPDRRISAVVITPLGTRQAYELIIP